MKSQFSLSVHGVDLTISALHRTGTKAPIVFLHGFGSTKEDYADIALQNAFDGHAFLAYDAPGCGQTTCADLSRISISFLASTALAMVDAVGFGQFHLVGHSMGGLTALMLADRHPHRVISFTNIEGNIAPEDCFLSRQIDQYPAEDAMQFLDHFIERTSRTPAYSSALYAARLQHNVRSRAVPHIFRSMVDLSDHGDLMRRFLDLPCPKMFMFGEQNSSLSYLRHIEERGVRLSKITQCGHFPMYSNPPAMWEALGTFTNQSNAK